MDLTAFDSFVTDITTALGSVGASVIGVAAVATGFTFAIAWIRKARGAASSG